MHWRDQGRATCRPTSSPADSKIGDEEERARLDTGVRTRARHASGFVLPIRRGEGDEKGEPAKPWPAKPWQQSLGRAKRWRLRRERLILAPGDCAARPAFAARLAALARAGRLPLRDRAGPARGARRLARCRSGTPLATSASGRLAASRETLPGTTGALEAEAPPRSAKGAVRTALTVEPRDGVLRLHAAAGAPGGLSGAGRRDRGHGAPREAPGADRGLSAARRSAHAASSRSRPIRASSRSMSSRPRAGARRWRSPPASMRTRAPAGLGADKFMIDGRHTGTGGGAHVVLGGASPANSPFLRRPDLLKSLLLYWQRHPALSYLFSGLFVGPTSQAPRVDEARHDALYELDIALGHDAGAGRGQACRALAGRPAAAQPPDRRHRQHPPHRDLHRQALFAGRPDRPAGPARVPRLRDAARRADEPRPAAADPRPDRLVLARTARAASWCAGARPCTTASCCRTSSGRDFLDVLADLREAGYAFDPAWFEAQREFRFPVHGAIEQYGGVGLELRHALEPWHVHGRGERGRRHGRGSSIPRSSGCRCWLTGFNPDAPCHHLQRPRLPMTATGVVDAGGRRRALQGLEAA